MVLIDGCPEQNYALNIENGKNVTRVGILGEKPPLVGKKWKIGGEK